MEMAEWTSRLKKRMTLLLSQTGQQTKNIKEKSWSYIMKHKKQSLSIAAGVLILAVAGVSADYYYTSNTYSIYHVYVNGEEIGVVNDPNVIHSWAAQKLKEEEEQKRGLKLTLADTISFKEETKFKGDFDNTAAITALSDIANIKVEAVKIVIDGKAIGYAASVNEAQAVLDKLKEKYAGNDGAATKKAVTTASLSEPAPVEKQVGIKEEVKFEKDTVTSAEVLSEDKLAELISKGTLKQVIHTVVEGDCIGCIAKKYGITSEDIYRNNPGITEDTVLQLGQQINVTAMRPLVTVQETEQVTQQEKVDYNVQIENNANLPKGETKVIQEGKEGSKLVTYEILKENGQVVDKKVLSQKVVQQPVAKIIQRGTKVIPSRGTGSFIWPARGVISSGFGTRWGKMHKGIDIAGSGAIAAADNGRVVFAGWDGDYGNAVIIDHGNGMETLYGHMRQIKVKVGDVVAQGKTIGIMGSTGDSTGVHLHFEVHQNGRLQNPLRFLR
ncbi:M23 family metallopeptidase [Brevibacillus fulvus]|uniref:Murein DD-endopeptidase MepM/ murein hydrolase activator NlpD n=1 Tax=Brevibacillus fulvus TaxID=1125967 RepID=A0A938Y3R3_9BACL|nr:M23 family metallopeptidase [Brevibacillus fulvus]MBM7591794.1 murein DD-endopeptidase MepM/ murein hydrolase activator NlpD [Brevibacillus fulvus]